MTESVQPKQPARPEASTFDATKEVKLERFPYPFKAAVAICSDIDSTSSAEEFLEIQNFMCTKEMTSMGRGVGLEIGNTFFMYAVPGHLAYFTGRTRRSCDEVNADLIADFVKAGYLDCLHTYGDLELDAPEEVRAMAAESIEVLKARGLKLDVWVDHGHYFTHCKRQNIGSGGLASGDKPGTSGYHTDLTFDYGIRFFWNSLTCLVGQDLPLWPRIIGALPLDRGRFLLKAGLGLLGHKRCRGIATNKLVNVVRLRDGRKVFGFTRFHVGPPGQGMWAGSDSKGLSRQLSPPVLNELVERGGYLIAFTHLGFNADCEHVIALETQQALRDLAKRYERGEIYVTTTSRLLNYHVIHKYLRWECKVLGPGKIGITVKRVLDPVRGAFVPTPEQLQGITFRVPDHVETRLFIGNQEFHGARKEPADSTGMCVLMFPRTFLEYPRGYS